MLIDGKESVRGASLRSSKRSAVAAAASPASSSPPAPAAAPLHEAPARGHERAAPALAHAAKGVEALGVLVQYLVCQMESMNSKSWRAEAARWRSVAAAERTSAKRTCDEFSQRAEKDMDTIGECLSKISELERELSSKEEQNGRLLRASREAESQYHAALQDIKALAAEIKGLKNTIDNLKRDMQENRSHLNGVGPAREHSLTPEPLSVGRDLESPQPDRHPDLDKNKAELVAEVRSLRAVLELKQAEASELRHTRSALANEIERRVTAERELETLRQAGEELRERATARQKDADNLRDDNRRLREGAVRDQQTLARLSLYNEELRYKLRQKSQVVSLLATGGGYLDRSYSSPRARASSCDSPPPPDTPPSPSDSPSPPRAPHSPAVKGVVEKQDSVSWVLEIEESPEEVANRIARRSNSFRSTGAGVKRRGGGSPGSPVPASPAPNASKLFRCSGERTSDLSAPPLKESAGEAIYIYDNRACQF